MMSTPRHSLAVRVSDHRRRARRLALQFLHALAVQRGGNLDQLDGFLAAATDNEQTRTLAHEWTTGAWRRLDELDGYINAVAANWSPERINQVDRANLRLAVYQFLHVPDTPPKVVINEAIELAKEFSTSQAPGFVNGVLDAIYRRLQAAAGAAPPRDSSIRQG